MHILSLILVTENIIKAKAFSHVGALVEEKRGGGRSKIKIFIKTFTNCWNMFSDITTRRWVWGNRSTGKSLQFFRTFQECWSLKCLAMYIALFAIKIKAMSMWMYLCVLNLTCNTNMSRSAKMWMPPHTVPACIKDSKN